MALSGTVNGSVGYNSKYFSFYFVWSAVQNIAENYSDVTVETYWKTNNIRQGFDTVGTRKASITINGTTHSISKRFNVCVDSSTNTNWATNPYLIQTATQRVYHNDDGTKSITISARANGHADKYGTSESTATSHDCTASKTIDLDTIPRVSVPTLSASSVKMGDTLTITTNRSSTSFLHELEYAFGGVTDTIAVSVGASHNWKVPDLAAKCNNALNGTCTITCTTYNGSTKIGTKTVNVTLTVPDAVTPTFPNGDVIIGKENPIETNFASDNFKATITYSFNGVTGTIVTKGGRGTVWWVTEDTAEKLAKAIPSKTSGEGTITCTTYNGTAAVGTKTVLFTAIVPDNSTTKPKITEISLSPSGNLPSDFDGLFIKGKTNVVATITAASDYSTIASYKTTVQSKSYSSNPATSEILTQSGNITVSGVVTDARGYTSEVAEKTIAVIPYSSPEVVAYSGETSIICERCTSDGTLNGSGTLLKIKAGRSYSKVMSDGTQKNFCLLKYRYKASGASTYSDPVTLLTKADTTDNVDVALSGIVESIVTSYTVQLLVTDTIGETVYYTFDIPTVSTDFHLREGGDGAAFGKYAEKAGVLECEWDGEFNKNVRVAGMMSAGHIGQVGKYDSLDFNELIYNTGYYIGTSAPSAAGCSNYPIDKTGILEVISAMLQNSTTLAWWGFAYQTYRSHDGQIYTRSYFIGDGWTSWQKMATA